MQEFARSRPEASGLYGDGDPSINHTYNFQTLLDQDYQYCYWEEVAGEQPEMRYDPKTFEATPTGRMRKIRRNYFLIQIHGGCDARWGFTAPVCFEAHDDAEVAVLYPTDATLYSNKGGNWYTDDGGSHWYWGGSTEVRKEAMARGVKMPDRLDSYPVMDMKDLRKEKKRMNDVRGRGVTLVGRTGKLYCPVTGGELQLS
jgi:hypothetical protein